MGQDVSPLYSMHTDEDESLYEARRQAILKLIGERFGTRAVFADHVGLQRPYVTRMLKPPGDGERHARRIGEGVALAIEQKCDLPPGSILYPNMEVKPERVIGASLSPDNTPVRGNRAVQQAWVVEPANGHFPQSPGPRSEQHDARHAIVASRDPRAFLFRVPDTSMAPRFNQGEYVLVEPGVTPEIEDDVLVRTTDGRAALARLVSRRNGAIRLGFWGAASTVNMAEEDLSWMYFVAHHIPARRVKA